MFNYNSGWAYHKIREKYAQQARGISCLQSSISALQISYQDVLAAIIENRDDWLKHFRKRWDFETSNQQSQRYQQEWENDHNRWERQKYQQSSTRTQGAAPHAVKTSQYQSYLDILQVAFPFSKQELKSAYRKQALKAHPDTGGSTES